MQTVTLEISSRSAAGEMLPGKYREWSAWLACGVTQFRTVSVVEMAILQSNDQDSFIKLEFLPTDTPRVHKSRARPDDYILYDGA
jgi:hypothetical protein